jgi:hypothetical protein
MNAQGEYIDAISEETEDELYRVVERCASTKSDDMATFPSSENSFTG